MFSYRTQTNNNIVFFHRACSTSCCSKIYALLMHVSLDLLPPFTFPIISALSLPHSFLAHLNPDLQLSLPPVIPDKALSVAGPISHAKHILVL